MLDTLTKQNLKTNLPEGTTVTVNSQTAEFPEASANMYTTTVSPILKKLPGAGGDDTRFTTPDISEALGTSQLTTTPCAPNGADCEKSSGQLTMTGGILSSVKQSFKTKVMSHTSKQKTTKFLKTFICCCCC